MKTKRPHKEKCDCYFCRAFDADLQKTKQVNTKKQIPDDWLCDCKDSTIRWVDEKHPHVAINCKGWFCMCCLQEFTNI
jgi:hypothetical protein